MRLESPLKSPSFISKERKRNFRKGNKKNLKVEIKKHEEGN